MGNTVQTPVNGVSLDRIPAQRSAAAGELDAFLAEHDIRLIVDHDNKLRAERGIIGYGEDDNGDTVVTVPPNLDPADILARVRTIVARHADRISAMAAERVALITKAHNPQAAAGLVLEGLALAEAAADGKPAARMDVVHVRDVPVTVPCPDWCVLDHDAEDLAGLDDIHHFGPQVSLTVPVYGGGTEQVLIANLAQWPLGNDEQGAPYLAVGVDDSGEVTPLQRSAALAFADQLVAHAAQVRRLARMLPEVTA